MFRIYTQLGISSKYSYNKNCTIPYFINWSATGPIRRSWSYLFPKDCMLIHVINIYTQNQLLLQVNENTSSLFLSVFALFHDIFLKFIKGVAPPPLPPHQDPTQYTNTGFITSKSHISQNKWNDTGQISVLIYYIFAYFYSCFVLSII